MSSPSLALEPCEAAPNDTSLAPPEGSTRDASLRAAGPEELVVNDQVRLAMPANPPV